MNNVILLQSYSSPMPLSADAGVLDVLREHYPNIKVVYENTPKVTVFGIKTILKNALKANFVARKGDVIFGWGGGLMSLLLDVWKAFRPQPALLFPKSYYQQVWKGDRPEKPYSVFAV